MDTGLVTKENEFIPMPYYEIGKFAEAICEEYVQKSEANKIHFETFSKNYNFFKKRTVKFTVLFLRYRAF